MARKPRTGKWQVATTQYIRQSKPPSFTKITPDLHSNLQQGQDGEAHPHMFGLENDMQLPQHPLWKRTKHNCNCPGLLMSTPRTPIVLPFSSARNLPTNERLDYTVADTHKHKLNKLGIAVSAYLAHLMHTTQLG